DRYAEHWNAKNIGPRKPRNAANAAKGCAPFFRGFRVPTFRGFRVPTFRGFRVPTFRGFRVPTFRVLRVSNSRVSASGSARRAGEDKLGVLTAARRLAFIPWADAHAP